jgi:hypothetical protein
MNGIVSLISFSTCSLLLSRKEKKNQHTDFCMLILYPAILPKVFIKSKNL